MAEQHLQERASRPAYTVEIRENGHRLSVERIVDPFVSASIKPRGWRAALDALLGRLEVEIIVGGDKDRVEAVMELDPDYLGPPGSESRTAWDAQINRALRDV